AAATSTETTPSSSSHPSSAAARSVAAVPVSGWLPSIQRRISTAAASQGHLDRAPRLLPLADPSSAGWTFSRDAPLFGPEADRATGVSVPRCSAGDERGR